MSNDHTQQCGDGAVVPVVPTPGGTGKCHKPFGAGGCGGLAIAGLSALLVWSAVQGYYPFFAGPATTPQSGGRGPSPPSPEEVAMAAHLESMNTTAVIGFAGAMIGAALSLGRALRGATVKFAAGAILVGGALGAASGQLGGWCSQWLSGLVPLLELGETRRAFLLQTVCWGATGLGVGLAMAVPLARPRRGVADSLTRGALGGILGALVYPIVSGVVGIVLPAGDTATVVPETGINRLIWLEAAAIGMALCLRGGGLESLSRGAAPISALLLWSSLCVWAAAIFVWGWLGWRQQAWASAKIVHDLNGVASAEIAPIAADDELSPADSAHLQTIGRAQDLKAVGDRFPDLRVLGWLNGPLTDDDRRGKVLLVDIWDGL